MTGILSSESGDSTEVIATVPAGAALSFAGKQAHFRDEVTLVANGIENILITPDPASKTMMFVSLSTTQGVEMELFKDSDASGGTPLDLVNYNREMPGTEILSTATISPTIVDDGNKLLTMHSASHQLYQDDIFYGEQTFILNRNMKYIFRFTSIDNNNFIVVRAVLSKIRDVVWF